MKQITDRQKQVYIFIQKYQQEKKRPPTLREIAHNFQFRVKTAFDHITALEKKGRLIRQDGSRGIVLITEKTNFLKWVDKKIQSSIDGGATKAMYQEVKEKYMDAQE